MPRPAPAALVFAALVAGCHDVGHHLPPYSAKVLALGEASAIAGAPDGSWFVAGAGQTWRVDSTGATTSWALPWAQNGGRGLQSVAEIAISRSGQIAIADPKANVIWNAGRVGQPATLSVLAGTGTDFYPIGDGDLAIAAQIATPHGVAWDAAGDLFVSDTGHNRVREVGANDRIFTLAGTGFPEPLGDGGPAQEAGLASPGALAVSKTDDVVVCDSRHNRTRIISGGEIRTLALGACKGLTIDDQGTLFGARGHQVDGWLDGDRTVVARGLHDPGGIWANASGQVAVADGDRVVLLTPQASRSSR